MDINKQLTELDEFTKITSLMNSILETKEKLNKNNIYDLVYCKRKLEKLLNEGIDNKDIESNSWELINRVDLLLESLGDRHLESLFNSKSKRNRHVDKTKYGCLDKFKDLEDPSRKEVVYSNPVKDYLEKNLSNFLALTICFIVTMIFPKLINVEMIESLPIAEAYIEFLNFACIIIRLLCGFVFVVSTLKLFFDLMYIINPIVRYADETILHNHSLFSADAKFVVSNSNTYVINHKVLDGDRVDIAKTILNKSDEVVKHWINWIDTYAINSIDSEDAKKHFRIITEDISKIKNTLDDNRVSIKDKIHAYVDAEIIYENLEEIIEFQNQLQQKKLADLKIICK